MTHTLLAVAAIICYSAAAALIGLRLFRKNEGWTPPRQLMLGLMFAGLLMHSWVLWDSIFSHAGLNLGFYNALALTSWTIRRRVSSIGSNSFRLEIVRNTA